MNNPEKNGYAFSGWTGTNLETTTTEVTINPKTMAELKDLEYTANYTPTDNLLTMSATPTTYTNKQVSVTINSLDSALTLEYKVGENGSWEKYQTSVIVKTNTTVYARASDEGAVIDTESITISNIDIKNPVIQKVTISDTWVPGTILKLKVNATDDTQVVGFAITSTNSAPSDASYTEITGEAAIKVSGLNFIWVKDAAGNTSTETFYAWDISKDEDEKIYAAIFDKNTRLEIAGNGETKSYASLEDVPYKNYKYYVNEICIKSGVTKINDFVLADMTKVKTISIPKTLTELSDNAIVYTNEFSKIEIDDANTNFSFSNYTLFDKAKTKIYIHSNNDESKTYTIPSSVDTIGNLAFYNNDRIIKIISSSNPDVMEGAFEECSNLIEIEGSIGGENIGKKAFAECQSLESIALSSTLKEIGYRAFYNTVNLSEIDIPKTVTTINDNGGAKEVFKNIGISTGNDTGKGIVKYYQSCTALNRYALSYPTEATFAMIDDVPASLISLKIEEPQTGTYAWGTEITIVAEFDETINEEKTNPVPTLTLKVGNGESSEVQNAIIQDRKIIYTYEIPVNTEGKLNFVSYEGLVYDVPENKTTVNVTEITGEEITVNTLVKLEEDAKATYYTKLQYAINKAKENPETASKITLLKNVTESVSIPTNKNIELDLNSKILEGEDDLETIINNSKLSIINSGTIKSNNSTVISTKSNAETKINGAKINTASSTKPAIQIDAEGSAKLNQVNIFGDGVLVNAQGEVEIDSSKLQASESYAIKTGNSSVVNIKSTTIESTASEGSTPVIYIATSATMYIDNSSIKSNKQVAIENNNTLEITGTSSICSTDAIAIQNKKIMVIHNANVSGESTTKETINNAGTITMYGGIINSENNIAVSNKGTLEMLGGSAISTSSSYNTIENKSNAILKISNATVTSENKNAIANSGKVTLENSSSIISKNAAAIRNNQAAKFTITSGDVLSTSTSGAVIENEGTLSIENANVYGSGEYGINNLPLGELKITNANLKVESKVKNVIGIYLQSQNKTTIDNITLNAISESGTAIGIKQLANELSITSGDVKSTSTSSESFGIYVEGGTTIVGTDDDMICENAPHIEGKTYGLFSTNAYLDFFDGYFVGSKNKSISGDIRNIPEYGFVKVTQSGDREISRIAVDYVRPSNVTLTASTYNWTNKAVTLSGDAEDDNSGIVAYAFTTSASTPESNEWTKVEGTPLSITKVISVSECKKLYFHVKDKAGNEAVSNEVEVKFDNVAPKITAITQDPEGWSAKDVKINITATDDLSGVNGYHYTKTMHALDEELNSYTEVSPTKSFTGMIVTDNATWYIYLKDQAGNIASGEYTVNKVDKTAPSIKVETFESGDGYTKLKITASDNASGIKEISINGTSMTLQSGENDLTKFAYYHVEDIAALQITAKDNVNNKSQLEKNIYQMTYYQNGGNSNEIYRFKLQDEDIAYINNPFVNVGYRFEGWKVGNDALGDAIIKNPGETYSENASCDIYATWLDITPPEILDIVKSENWDVDAKENLKIKIMASDNDNGVMVYAITQTATKPERTSMQASNEFTINSEGKYYVWVEDLAKNYTSGDFTIYNVSKTASDKNAYAILKKNNETNIGKTLQIVGSGDTMDFATESEIKWKAASGDIARVEIKESIKSIGNKFLANLANMNELVIAKTVDTIAIDALMHSNNYSNIYISGSKFYYTNGMLIDQNNTKVYAASTKTTPSAVSLYATIAEIAPYAFENSKIESIIVKSNINLKDGVFKNASKLKTLTAENGIGGTSIGKEAFYGCTKLEYLEISSKLQTLGENVFKDCTNLTDIVMPGSIVTMPASGVFENIGTKAGTGSGKGYVYYRESSDVMTAYALADATKDEATFIGIDDVKPVVQEVVINSGDTLTASLEVKVYVRATDNHTVEEIYISNTETTLTGNETGWKTYNEGQYDFTLIYENGQRNVYVYAKDSNGNISLPNSDSIILAKHEFNLSGDSVINQYKDETEKDYYAYREQGAVIEETGFTIQNSGDVDHETVGAYVLDYIVSYSGEYVTTYHRTVNILANSWGTTEYEDDKFFYVLDSTNKYAKVVGYKNNNADTSVEFPASVKISDTTYPVIDIGDGVHGIARNGTSETKIASIKIPNSVIAISDYAFGNFTNISSIDYGYNLMTIGKYAFTNWATYKREDDTTYQDTTSTAIISSLTIKENVREVKQGAFDRVTIDDLTIEDGVKAIYENAFRGNNNTNETFELEIPESIDKLGDGTTSPFTYMELSKITVDENNLKYKSGNGGKELLTIDGKVLMQYASANTTESYTVSTGVETIGTAAFAGATSLKGVTLPATITKILDSAFKNSGLTSIEIPANTTKIYASTFEGTKLQEVYIRTNISEVDDRAFAKISTLGMVVFEGAPEIGNMTFVDDSILYKLVMLDKQTVASIDEVSNLPKNTYVYVPSASMESAYESATNWSSLGADRIKHIVSLSGDDPAIIDYGEAYAEQGISVLGEFFANGSGESTIISGLTIVREDLTNTNVIGEYEIRYKLYYSGDQIGYKARVVKVVDELAPKINGVETSSSWTPGTALKLKINAEDDYDGTDLTYAITANSTTSNATWGSSSELTILGEENYVHARDKSKNYASLNVKAWDISKTDSQKKVYAYLIPSGELVITGSGETAGFAENDTPWVKAGITIKKITVEEGVTKLGENVLASMENVKEIRLPKSLTDAANTAFAKTNNFDSIIIGSGDSIGAGMKMSGDVLMNAAGTKIYMRNRNASGDAYSSGDQTYYEYTMPENVTSVASYAFYKNTVSRLTVSKNITEIGTKVFVGTTGKIRYYTSSDAMRAYVASYSGEADFEMIDDVAPTSDAPTLKASSSIIVVTAKQTDRDSGISTLLYNIRRSGDAYSGDKWQTQSYFTGLTASTTYFVKTKATDGFGNSTESNEASIDTKAVPDQINLTATPSAPTSGDVTVTIEWPEALINLMYGGLDWPAGSDVVKQVGTRASGESSITWANSSDQDASTTSINVHENYTTIYARLFDGTNYTKNTCSITIAHIDRIAPTGIVIINSGDTLTYSGKRATLDNNVQLYLSATDDRTEPGFGVEYYLVKENDQTAPSGDTSRESWISYEGAKNYAFTISETRGLKTVNVWFMDTAGNVSACASGEIYMLPNVVKLSEAGVQDEYFYSLEEAIEAAKSGDAIASTITLLKNLTGEYEESNLNIASGKNIIVDMNNCNVEAAGAYFIENHGKLKIQNSQSGMTHIKITGTDAIGINNFGILEITGVTIESPVAILNQRS